MRRVLVGCPTADAKSYCLEQYVGALKCLTYPFRDVLLVDNSADGAYAKRIAALGLRVIRDERLDDLKQRIAHSRNVLRGIVLKEGYDYLFCLEQDVIPPADVIERLLRHGKKIISGAYHSPFVVHGRKVVRPLLWAEVPGKPEQMRFMSSEVKEERLARIKACGVGCILIHREVLEKISFRVPDDKSTYDDIAFCLDAAKAGFELWADTGVQCEHLIGGDHNLI